MSTNGTQKHYNVHMHDRDQKMEPAGRVPPERRSARAARTTRDAEIGAGACSGGPARGKAPPPPRRTPLGIDRVPVDTHTSQLSRTICASCAAEHAEQRPQLIYNLHIFTVASWLLIDQRN
jgi:hypothetical protein